MKSLIKVLVISVAFWSLLSCASKAQNQTEEEVQNAIESNFQQMGAAMQNGNATELAGYFTKDAFFKLPGQAPVKGREAIQKVHEGMISQGLGLRPSTEEVQVLGDHAIELGSVDILGPDGNVVNKAYYLTLWKKIDGEWKISRDIVSSMPPAQE